MDFLFEYIETNLGLVCDISFNIYDYILLIIAILTLKKFVDFKEFIKGLSCMYNKKGYKQIMEPQSRIIHNTNTVASKTRETL